MTLSNEMIVLFDQHLLRRHAKMQITAVKLPIEIQFYDTSGKMLKVGWAVEMVSLERGEIMSSSQFYQNIFISYLSSFRMRS